MSKENKDNKNPHRRGSVVSSKFRRMYDFVLSSSAPRYQTQDGGYTTDVSDALCDPFGRPVQCGYDNSVSHPVDLCSPPLCLDPSDMTSRLRALEARQRFNDFSLPPVIYEDSVDAAQRANNICNKLIKKFNASSPASSPASTPASTSASTSAD